MKILFSTFGSLGDIHPYLAVALEAKRRGHTPLIATSARYGSKIEAQGIEFRAVAPDMPPDEEFAPLAKQVMDERDGPRFLFEEILAPSIKQQYTDLLEASADADIVVTHPAAMAGPLVARKLHKKWVSSVLAPISLWSRRDPAVPPTMPHLERLRAFGSLWGAIQVKAGELGTRKWVHAVEQLQRELGLESGGHPMFGGQFSPHGTIAMFSPNFCAPQRDWPANTTATGFCFYDAVGLDLRKIGSAPDWRAWMQDGSRPVVFGLGSAAVHDGAPVWEAAVRAAKRDNVRVVLLTAGTFETDEPNVLCVPYAPYSEIFPLAQHIFHQGGIGTTAQALRSGVTQTIIPFAHDQSDNAARVKRLGVGRWMRRNDIATLDLQFTRYITDSLMNERARKVGALIREENGPLAACEALEKLA